MKLIAITGGIGSGKSVVSRMVQVMGYHVYDCDSRAKLLMTENPEVKQRLIHAFGPETYLDDGSINRLHLSAIAFADDESRATLNGIVHPATFQDISQWGESQSSEGADIAFVETALFHTAKMEHMFDSVWHVTAPADIRIQRVMARSGLTAKEVQARIAAQTEEDRLVEGEQVIVNDDNTAVMPQVMRLLSR